MLEPKPKRRLQICAWWVLLLCAVTVSAARDKDDQARRGEQVFQRGCSFCHSVAASDPRNHEAVLSLRGPSLAYSGEKYNPEWLEGWLKEPTEIRPAGYLPFRQLTVTPDGDRIDEKRFRVHVSLLASEAHEVALYLLSLKKESNQFPVSAASSEIPGKILFEKILGCGSCHQSEPGRGGVSAPELYTAGKRLRREWVRAFVADPQYWNSGLMPKTSAGATQLDAVVGYLFEPKVDPTPNRYPKSKGHVQEAPTESATNMPQARLLYLAFCSQCHGVQGNGKGINAPVMSVAPRNHASSEEMAGLTDERLFAAIKFGGPAVGKSSLMPSWAALLTDREIDSLVGYLHTLSSNEVCASRTSVNHIAFSLNRRSTK